MVFNVQKSDVFNDTIRAKNKKHEDTKIGVEYQSFLRTIMENAENDEPQKRERENNFDIHHNSAKRSNLGSETRYESDDQIGSSKKNKVKKEGKGKNKVTIEGAVKKHGQRTNKLTESQHECVDRPQTRHKDSIVTRNHKRVARGKEVKKEKNVVKEENVVHVDNGLSNPTSKNQFGCDLQARSNSNGININSSKAKAVVDIKEEKESDDESDSDVEILDGNSIQIRGVLSCFDPSTRFLRSDDDDSQDLVCDEFRKRVLEVLNKPFNKEELARHREAVKAGDYYTHYPDFGKKMKKHRYNRRKCLAILRGFFFWLQNVCIEGSFKPWKDGECLKVEPQYA